MKMMNIIEEKERYEQEVEILENFIIWTELLSLFLLLVSSKLRTDPIGLLLMFSNSLVTIFFSLRPKLSSPAPFGNVFWLVLLSRFMLLLAFNNETEYSFLLLPALFIFIANHSVYIFEYLVGSSKPHNDEISTSTESRGIEDDTDDVGDVGDVSEELEKMRELVKELRIDEEMMDIEIEFMEEEVINSGLETHRKNLSLKISKFREELRDDEEKMKTYKEWMKKFIYSELEDHLRLNADKMVEDLLRGDKDIKASRDNVEVIAEEVRENYLVIQETVGAAKSIADRANLAYLATQAIIEDINKMRWMIKEEDLEGFLELREEVRRMSLEFEARRMEAEDMVERAAEELSRVTLELEEAVEIRQWEEYRMIDEFVTRRERVK